MELIFVSGLIIGFASKLFYLVLTLFPRKLIISCYNFQERIHFHNKTLITFFRLVNPIFDIMDIKVSGNCTSQYIRDSLFKKNPCV